ncbi:MAG: DsrE family protein [Candidatus Thermoplasmatota archaeon]|nr:DsrE family protein [Candidatus Thermoplasmatota archaeon]MCL5441962.1 DsrE family protein [Candidatus Thermoplasmatota archaeon]
MTGKIAIVINSGLDQRAKVMSGLHVAKRIYDAREENNIDSVEVFLFTGGVRAMESGKDNNEVLDAIKELREAGITLEACSNQVKNWNMEDIFSKNGINLEFARDAFSRYAVEGYTVISF